MCININIPDAGITPGEAVALIKDSVDQKCEIAIASLGGLYIAGKGVPKDERKALELLYPSAERGISNSQWALGHIYATSKDLSNPAEALKWYRASAKEGWHHAQYHLGFYCQSRNMLPEAVVNLKASAEQGNMFALNELGVMYTKGNTVINRDYKAAFPLFFQSATEGHHALAERNLGWLYAEGLGVDPDPKESVRWYMKAADHGDSESQYIIGSKFKRHYHSQPTNPDLRAKAHDYLSRAAKQGHEKANLELITLDTIPVPTGGSGSSSGTTGGSCIVM